MTKAQHEDQHERKPDPSQHADEILKEALKEEKTVDIATELIEANIDEFDELAKKTKKYGLVSEQEKKEAAKKMDFLLKQIDESLKDYERRKRRNRRPALLFKILIAGLSSVVTILLGIRVEEIWVKHLDQIALVISALMSVVTTWNAFYDYTALWVQFTKTVAQLGLLHQDIEYMRMGNEEITVSEVNYLKERYDDILHEAVKLVVRVRSEDVKDTKR